MTQNQETTRREAQKPGTPGPVSRWMQKKMNARMNRKIRKGSGEFMGMDVLILNTKGRRSGQPRETPVAWFADGDERVVVASGGGSQNPDWYENLMANPGEATIELPGDGPQPVTPQVLDGAEREQAWQRVTTAQPRMAKYQGKSDRQYPIVRLASRLS